MWPCLPPQGLFGWWDVGNWVKGLVGGTETPCQHRQVQGWQGHSQPRLREKLPASHLCWGCFSQKELG